MSAAASEASNYQHIDDSVTGAELEADNSKSSGKMSLFDRYFDWLDRWKKVILVLWLLAGIGSAVIGPRFFNSTSASSGDAPGTPVYLANQIYADNFPEAASTNSLLILVERITPPGWDPKDTTVLTPVTEFVTQQVFASCITYQPADMFRSIDGYFIYINTNYSDMASEFVTPNGQATMIAVSYDGNGDVNAFIHSFEDLVRGNLQFPLNTPEYIQQQYSFSITGLDLLFDDTVTGSERDFVTMDSIVLPLALIVLALYLRNLRMMIIPLASVGLSLLTSFTVMYPIAIYGINVASFAPSIMVSTGIALSIDYSLFLLTRYREEKLKMIINAEKKRAARAASGIIGLGSGLTPMEDLIRQNYMAVRAMLKTAGHVVLVSGSTLMLTFMGLVFFPMTFLQSVGIGAAFTLFFCLWVNLQLTPVLLLLFPSFFGTFQLVPACLARRLGEKWTHRIEGKANMRFQRAQKLARMHAEQDDADAQKQRDAGVLPLSKAHQGNGESEKEHGVLVQPSASFHEQAAAPSSGASASDSLLSSPVSSPPSVEEEDDGMDHAALLAKQERSFWFRSARCTTTTKYSWFVILLVLAISLPFCYFALDIQTSSDVNLVFPRDSQALKAFQELNTLFRPGFIDPFHMIATTNPGGVWTPEFFQIQQDFSNILIANSLIANDSITAISYFKGTPVSFKQANDYFDEKNAAFNTPAGFLYRSIVNSSVNADQSTTYMNLVTSFNPDGTQGPYWIDTVRGYLENMEVDAEAKGLQNKYYLNGGATDDLDSYRKVNSLFPTLIVLTVCCVFLIVALLFRSFLVPLRLVFTIGLSISWVYGFAVLVFQKGMFNWLSSNLKDTNTIFWMETVMTFSILTGLGLDYDVFLFSRVAEYRMLGYTNRAAIIKAIYSTGEIITVAGTIMGIAFGGLMGSTTMVLNQFGFVLCFAVLFDTFVIRTLLVPAILHLLGSWNWFPGIRSSKPVPEKYTEHDFVEALEGEEGDEAVVSAAKASAARNEEETATTYGSGLTSPSAEQ